MIAWRPARWMHLVGLAASLLVGLAFAARPLGMAALRALVAACFGDVPAVSTAELAAELQRDPRPLLLDARSAAEFAVSHLPGARNVGAQEEEDALGRELPKDARIVVYCSVGWRSASLARRLRARGFASVRNLDGSAFAWANEGRPLAGAHGAAGRVHPYAAAFAWLLAPAARGPAW